jgi:putative peptidoglycan lipid II flippase
VSDTQSVSQASGGRSLARGAALITIATAASRITGFVRVVVVAAAMGTTFLANTYQTANTAPNVIFELVAAGVLTSVFVPTFVDYVVKGRHKEGWDAANALTSVALVGLVGVSLIVALAAPLIMQVLTIGVEDAALREREIALGTTFLRLFSPQIALYGIGMIMTGALHAYRYFGMAAVAPIFNNVVVIGVYIAYAVMRSGRPPSVEGITTAETVVLGVGTTLGVLAMTLCLVPQLWRLGWRYRFRFEPSHPAVRRGARLGVWALGYAGGYQAGLIVVLILANRIEGGVAAYQWAYTFFYLPHALFAIPIFNVLFTAMSEHVARGEEEALLERLRDGLGMLAFLLLPIAAVMIAAAEPLTNVTLRYGVMTGAGAALVARVLAAFAIGLPMYSAFLVFTRAYYAVGDARTPTFVNALTIAISSVVGAVLFASLPSEWAVPGLALGHSVGFAVGGLVLTRLFYKRVGAAGSTKLTATLIRAAGASVVAFGLMSAVRLITPEGTRLEWAVSLILTTIAGVGAYVAIMAALRAPELERLQRVVTGLGRRRR